MPFAMTQTRTVDAFSTLRSLPLPGRGDGIYPDSAAATRNARTDLDAARAIAGTSSRAESFVAVTYGANIRLPQPPANNTQPPSLPAAAVQGGGAALSDEVVGFLLQANEITDGAAVASFGTARASLARSSYQDAAAVFPRGQDSLFSLTV